MSLVTTSASAEDAHHVFMQWDALAQRGDVAGLLELYTDTATVESPLVPHVLGMSIAQARGRDQIRSFFAGWMAERAAPTGAVWYRSGVYHFDGHTLVWEYPRLTPSGSQPDFIEVMELRERQIAKHRIYWGALAISGLSRPPR